MTSNPYRRMIRWYPPAWRERYGTEMAALLEDRYLTASAVPWRARMGLIRSGLAERARAAGLQGSAPGPAEQVRAGSVMVLSGWALFLVGGAVFAKFADNWSAMTPSPTRWMAGDSYDAVALLGILGCAWWVWRDVVGRAVDAPRARQEMGIGAPILAKSVGGGGIAVVLLGGAVAWAHHSSQHDRNGGLAIHGALFVVVGLAAVAAVGCATAAAVSVARRIELSSNVLRMLGLIALALSGVMALLLTGIVVWWSWVAIHAPGVLLNGIGTGLPYTSNVAPPTLVAAGALLAMGLVLALGGSRHVARSWRGLPSG